MSVSVAALLEATLKRTIGEYIADLRRADFDRLKWQTGRDQLFPIFPGDVRRRASGNPLE
jgi:hypothetical protein